MYLQSRYLWELVGAGYHEYNADYVFATVQTLNRDEHLLQYAEDTFDCINFG